TSHGAILLRALGVPTVARARRALASWLEGGAGPVFAALDGGAGGLWLDPSPEERRRLGERLAGERRLRAREAEEALRPARLEDGEEVSVVANVGSLADARAGLARGAEGIGLLRTEFLFLDRAAEPSEEEQTASLRAILDVMGDRPVVVRTLDAGGDKELPYLSLPEEENPFLGVRALRLCLRRPELFRAHLRALLRAGEGRDLRILFPMVSGVAEFRRAKQALSEARESLRAEGIPHAWPVPVGTMIEIPSAALTAESLAAEADFFSIGTNDLTQYTLAADRGNPELASFHDALHPAVLALVDRVVRAAARRGRPVAVCGEAAADPVAAAVFVGLGVRELSLGAASIPALKASLRARRLPDLRALAAAALACGDAPEARALAAKTLSSNPAPHPIGAA
ncbi:MAG TPA: phosphoenolpyruvate--protein phosphotransferase, partial [Candidatus Methylacidiphilales bacterium]